MKVVKRDDYSERFSAELGLNVPFQRGISSDCRKSAGPCGAAAAVVGEVVDSVVWDSLHSNY